MNKQRLLDTPAQIFLRKFVGLGELAINCMRLFYDSARYSHLRIQDRHKVNLNRATFPLSNVQCSLILLI